MIRTSLIASVTALAASSAFAGGLDRTGQPIDIIFAEGNYAQLNLSFTQPSVSATGIGIAAAGVPAGTAYSDIGSSCTKVTGGLKFDITPDFAMCSSGIHPLGQISLTQGAISYLSLVPLLRRLLRLR